MPRHTQAMSLLAVVVWAGAGSDLLARTARAHDAAPPDAAAKPARAEETVREIFVPFEDLGALLENQPQRVLLSRAEYEALLKKAGAAPSAPPAPHAVLPVSATYEVVIGQERAEVAGTVVLEVMRPGLQVVNLELAGVGLRHATLDGRAAALGQTEQGGLRLFVESPGRHVLLLDMIAPVETTAALQTLSWQGPTTPATRMQVRVPGNVEVKGGAHVVARTFDEGAQVTQFELLPPPGPMTLVMTLNNRLLQTSRAVLAHSVLIDELTEAYERLHATFSLAVLHRPVDNFRFALPDGFELTDVKSPLLTQWSVSADGSQRVLDVRLREPTTETVVVTLSAVRTPGPRAQWTLPMLRPMDVLGEVAVVGLLLEARWNLQTLESERLIPIDTNVLTSALPASVFEAERGAPVLRPVAAFYAPTGSAGFDLRAQFERPAARLLVTTSVHLTLAEKELQVRAAFTLRPEVEKLFAVEITVPPDWHVLSVSDPTGQLVPFDLVRHEPAIEKATRLRVRLPAGVAPDSECALVVQATHVPAGWLADWLTTRAAFPAFSVLGATRDSGAIAVQPGEDLLVYPDVLEHLTPLDEKEAARYGLPGGSTVSGLLAYRYEAPPYVATFRVERIPSRLTARCYSFLRLSPGVLTAHYELVYDIREARVPRLSFALPASTPADVLIRGLDGASVKEYEGVVVDEVRRWNVLLAEQRRGTVRLAVDFEQQLGDADELELALPIVHADGVAYQAGTVAVEGSAELDMDISSHPRKVDVGELAGAEYQPSQAAMGGLGVFGYVGAAGAVNAHVARRVGFGLPPAIVQRAELMTLVSADGHSQTSARFQIRSKADFLEVELPPGALLWSAELDGQPITPQRGGQRLLLSLAGAAVTDVRDLRIVYETPVQAVAFWGTVDLSALRLLVPAGGPQGMSSEVPVADLIWHISLPSGYRIVAQGGTVSSTRVARPEPAAWTVARTLYQAAGGINFFYGGLLPSLGRAREQSKAALSLANRPRAGSDKDSYGYSEAPESTVRGDMPARMEGRRDAAAPEMPALTPPTELAGGEKAAGVTKLGAGYWALEGVRSLKIELERAGEAVSFQSLGGQSHLSITLAQWRRVAALTWALSLAVVLVGVTLTKRPVRTRLWYIIAVILLATVLPLITVCAELAHITNGAFYAATLLVPFYLLVALVRWLASKNKRPASRPAAATGTALLVLLCGYAAPSARAAAAEDPKQPITVQVVEPPKPVHVPDDAIIVPFDPQVPVGPERAMVSPGPLLIPYQKYIDLWNRAFPQQRMELDAPPAPYALAGAAYSGTLADEESLTLEGQIDLDVYADSFVAVPINLGGAVLTRAELDGAPARLSVAPADVASPASDQQTHEKETATADDVPLLLHVQGLGRHRLVLTVRLPIARRGGWHVASGRVPAAPATALTLRVPHVGTELSLGAIRDRRSFESESPDEVIATALDTGGALALQWRPKVQEGRVDPTLTAASVAVLDVREDGLHLIWKLNLDFGRTERDSFAVAVPQDYLVEKVDGSNVRGWALREEQGPASAPVNRTLEVTLLKPVRGAESVVLWMHRRGAVGEGELATFDAPLVQATGAVLHSGQLAIRRSPLLDLRTGQTTGVTRTDTGAEMGELAAQAGKDLESPLGLRPYQAYRFAATPFVIRLAATRRVDQPNITVQTVLRIAERQRSLETRISVDPAGVPVYRLRVALPAELRVEHVSAPGAFEWSVAADTDGPVLAVYLTAGQQQPFSLIVRGKLGADSVVESVALPRLAVLTAGRQSGEIVVQVDPAFDLRATELRNCRDTELWRVLQWLTAAQQPWARLALAYEIPDYAGTLRLTLRTPQVACSTITNVRVTETAIEETILLDFVITRAGLRSVVFTLPKWMKDARITVPMLREKQMVPTSAEPGVPLRVTLTLQDEVMGRLRVLVEHDRLLTSELQHAPLPTVETGRTDRRSVALESAGRDEVVIETSTGLEALGERQKDWQELAALLGSRITQAYIATGPEPVLAYKTKERAAVETAGGRIGLGQTALVIDDNGTYRAAQTYRIDNSTEQFLEVQLPTGAELWSAVVANTPVKPARVPDPTKPRNVRIPLLKTAPGDLDYAVTLHYGGRTSVSRLVRKVDFPLVRTVNLQVELSQVQLYLPEDYRWFDFGGTLRQVTDEGELAAGFVGYQTRVAERLSQTMNSASPFAQIRAAANWKGLRSQMDQFQQSAERYRHNERLRQELASNGEIVRRAEAQLGVLAQSAPSTAEPTLDNRETLNVYYTDQQINRARNLVQDLAGNFGEIAADGDKGEQRGQAFDHSWLEANKLTSTAPTKDASDRVQFETGKEVSAKKEGKRTPPPPQAPSDASFGNGKTKEPGGPIPQQQLRRAAKAEATAARYQRQLEERGAQAPAAPSMQPAGQAEDRITAMEGRGSPPAGGVVVAPTEREVGFPTAPAASTGVATGLASLTVEFPLRGRPYYFTTPRGEVSITARSVSQVFLGTLGHAGVVLLAIALVVLAQHVWRRPRASRSAGPLAPALLIALGLASIVTGILPIAGAAAVALGIVLRLTRGRPEPATLAAK